MALLAGCSQEAADSTASPSAASDVAETSFPQRAYWGDEHVHTGWSVDAGLSGTRLSPEDAVRFAQGEEIKSSTGVMMKLHKPLDWIAVTDHSDGMGTISELMAGNAEFLADKQAKAWYDMVSQGDAQATKAMREIILAQSEGRLPKVFMDSKWVASAWEKNVDIMEKYNKPGAFTAFISYEC
ncbi:DUF3604 domain-containing protein [Novosphingobium profundi]|uniref:DUF3604 domain-containing protein n=1 Tax=Novosphingobium profundi TaxID=1774954 RepID=UPI001BD9A95A|nr:DUF3604 domain-containing protein [Novosphingobium profundi]MBT0668052.1 DUF3604 domain-containing protein [Novosphingobium profundi]